MKKALILVAHADDETLGAGGLIQKLKKYNYEINVVIISNGIVTVRGVKEENSIATFKACKFLGIKKKPIFIGIPDQNFETVPISEIANKVGALGIEPDLIITHADTDLNKDHIITLEVAKIIGRPKYKPVSIIGCEIPNNAFWNTKLFAANYYVDISNEIDNKIKAFSFYENEIQRFPHPWSSRGLKLLAEYHGLQSGFQYAEAYVIYRSYNGHLI